MLDEPNHVHNAVDNGARSGGTAIWEWRFGDDRIVGDGRFASVYGISFNEAARGISPATFFSIIHSEDVARIRLAVGGIRRGAELFSKEFRILHPDGSVHWVHARGRSRYGNNEKTTGFSGVIFDITEQKRIEEQLRIAQTAGGVGTFEHIDGFGTLSVSEQFCRLLGLQPTSNLPVHTVNSVVHPEDPPIIDGRAGRTPGAMSDIEFRVVRRDNGQLRWLKRRGEFTRDADTSGVRYIGVIYDITSAKAVEGQLRTLNETLEVRVEERTRERDKIWQLSHDLLGIADTNGIWLSINPAWMRTLGWTEIEIIGRSSEWLEHPDDQKATRGQWDHLVQGGTSAGFQNRFRTRDGQYRSLAWTAVPDEGLLYCVARDITDQLEREQNLARAEEQLRQSQKMEAIGQLTGGIAHDFNNMLTGVTAGLDLIRRRLSSGRTDDLERYIEAASTSAWRAAALTHSLLAFARRQSLDVKPQNVNELVSGLEQILRRTLSETISFNFALHSDLWLALTDANQFENALLNLVINARDAMPDGGQLTIETSNGHLPRTGVLRTSEELNEYVIISVSDTGSGMSPDVVAKAFEPFFTTKPIGQGTGLGLSMIYGFVKQSGGHVRISSEVGRGTIVKMYLRRARHSEQQVDPSTEFNAPRGRGETVLVVEDDASVRLILIEVLTELGYQYIEAADGAAALPHLESDRQIDLLVTDVGLPNMNGRQLAEIGRQKRPELKVLFITGYAEKAAVRSGFLAPGMEMMSKPFTIDAVGAKIRELIEK
jgi:PAS domain S-box-containing protein